MCTRYEIDFDGVQMHQAMGAVARSLRGQLPDREIFPKRLAYVVRVDSERFVDTMHWGFPPPPASKAPVVNVRNLSSPFWRSVLAKPSQRCLVPVSAFCEWSGEKGAKQAHWFSIPSRPVFAFAGIWRPTESGNVFAFLTCEPNQLVGAVHPKAMPVILHDEDYSAWLDGADAEVMATAYPSQLMTVR